MGAGDTLFALGCGRLFEGTADQMWQSLNKLLHIPAATRVCCGHEYTQSNARFAAHFDPTNEALQARKANIDNLRGQVLPMLEINQTIALAQIEDAYYLCRFQHPCRCSFAYM